MKVAHIYFIPFCPGLPVYQLVDGRLMMPFSRKGKGGSENTAFFWATEDELTNGVSDTKLLFELRQPFRLAELEIKYITGELDRPKKEKSGVIKTLGQA